MKKKIFGIIAIIALVFIACDDSKTTHTHTWGGWSITTPATCKDKGEQTRTCGGCTATQTEEIAVDPNAHDWNTTPKTISEGVKAITCKYCNEKKDYTFDYSIGSEGSGGGVIIYVADGLESRPLGFTVTGQGAFTAYYLEAAIVNQGTINTPQGGLKWATSGFESTDITGTGTAIGTGKENTRLILAIDENAPAAKACDEYSNNGKTDWFLPSKDELNEMFNARNHLGMSGSFWSSSQSSYYRLAWGQDFPDGTQESANTKENSMNGRAIRAF